MSVLTDAGAVFQSLPEWQQRAVLVALTLLVGFLTIRIIIRTLDRSLRRIPRIDETLREFLDRLVDVVAWSLLTVVVLGTAGVNVGALLGGLAIGGFVLGFALKDTLGNLAAGVMLLFYRPFNVGDTITLGSNEGEVTALGMALTTLAAADGRLITVPNGAVLGGAIVNHTRSPVRRADVLVGISYDDDIDAATRAILEAVSADSRVLADPAPGVRITGLGASSIDLQVRPWVQTGDFWQTKADLNATVKRAVEDAGCTIPFPQRDVHMHQVAG